MTLPSSLAILYGMKNRKLFAPDLLRVLSMLFVVLYHVNMELRVLGRDPRLAPIDAGANIEFGQLGTVLFIILAGFTSVLSYERIEEKGAKKVFTYYKKRFLAILPAFYIAYFLAFIMIRLPITRLDGRIIFTLLGVDGYLAAHGAETLYLVGEWFTGCILMLYLVFPLLYLLTEKALPAAAALALLMKIGAVLLIQKTGLTDCDILFYAPDFIFGIIAAKYLRKPNFIVGLVSFALAALLILVHIPLNYRYMISPLGIAVFLAVMMLVGKAEEIASGKAEELASGKGEMPVLPGRGRFVLEGLKKTVSVIARYSYAVFLVHHVLIGRIYGGLDPNMGRKAYLLYLLLYLVFTAVSAVIVQGAAEYVRKLFPEKKKEA